ncbi:hypothetical protein ACOSQ4_030788 [Xanthoceras sorbifolium]
MDRDLYSRSPSPHDHMTRIQGHGLSISKRSHDPHSRSWTFHLQTVTRPAFKVMDRDLHSWFPSPNGHTTRIQGHGPRPTFTVSISTRSHDPHSRSWTLRLHTVTRPAFKVMDHDLTFKISISKRIIQS